MPPSIQFISLLAIIAGLAGRSTHAAISDDGKSDAGPSPGAQLTVRFTPNRVRLGMNNSTRVDYTIAIDKTALKDTDPSSIVQVRFSLTTLSPQFDIIEFNQTDSLTREEIKVSVGNLTESNYVYNSSIYLKATYIGHATISLYAKLTNNWGGFIKTLSVSGDVADQQRRNLIDITIVKDEGILDKIFMYSVIIFITISYINLGAQIDVDNVRKLVMTPKIVFYGFLIGVVVMPSASWFAGYLYFENQPMYRIGSFIYATAPAASASVLWTVLFDSDKELALGLQITSTVGALFTMPALLYALDSAIDLERQYTIQLPYTHFLRTLVGLLVALLIGSQLVGRSKRAKQISQRIFRPLTMFVLLFIVGFSSIVYWYIYRMFNLNITLMALVVTCATYVLSGLLGYSMKQDLDHLITISISSTYRNSGIAFAALVVTFQPPDVFIAYVPCLTQVVMTSLIGLVLLSIKSLRNYYSKLSTTSS